MSIIRILLTLFVSRSMLESAWADMKFIDLIHAIPTFKPKLNLHNRTKPITQSAPSAGFYQQAILYPTVKFDTSVVVLIPGLF